MASILIQYRSGIMADSGPPAWGKPAEKLLRISNLSKDQRYTAETPNPAEAVA